jgi:hypothetical protein
VYKHGLSTFRTKVAVTDRPPFDKVANIFKVYVFIFKKSIEYASILGKSVLTLII